MGCFSKSFGRAAEVGAWWRLLIATGVSVSLAGCALLVPEPEPFQVAAEPPTATITARRTEFTLRDISFAYYRCDYTIGLRAVGGRSNDVGKLQMAVLRGSSGERLGTIPLSELVSWFGTDQIKSGQRVSVLLYDQAIGSWSRTVDFLYTAPDGSARSVSYTVRCA